MSLRDKFESKQRIFLVLLKPRLLFKKRIKHNSKLTECESTDELQLNEFAEAQHRLLYFEIL